MSTRQTLLPCVEIEPSVAARFSVVWLHGLGADGHDFAAIAPYLGIDAQLAVRFVFPHAPQIPVSINGGMRMPAWYDISDVDLRHRHDEVGILRSSRQVEALIEREVERGVPTPRIILAGFSQGGAIATHVALRHARPLAGLMALSTYLVRGDALASEIAPANRGLHVFQAHGTEDMMVRYERGVALRDRLLQLGYDVEWKTYPMEHQVCPQEIADIGGWLQRELVALDR